MVIGDLARLNVRAQVDEEDVGLIARAATDPSAKAKLRASARTRGAVATDLSLELVRIEPFARPKTELTGVNSERVDTRVIDVVLRIAPGRDAIVFPGQAVDVFIERLKDE